MKILHEKNIRRILVIKNDKIGDMVLSTGTFRELKRNFPKAGITVIASKSNKQIIEKNKNIDKIIVLDYPPRGYKGILNYFKLSKELKKENYDVGIDLRGSIINIFFPKAFGTMRAKAHYVFFNTKNFKVTKVQFNHG